jgi:tetrahydromethanopterin S-methyltransferase subunit G
MTVSERLKESFESARSQFNGIEKQVEKKVAKLEKKARQQIEGVKDQIKDQIDEVPAQLRGAFGSVVQRLRNALAFATRDEFDQLSSKLDELAKKVDKLIRGDKLRASGAKVNGPKKV